MVERNNARGADRDESLISYSNCARLSNIAFTDPASIWVSRSMLISSSLAASTQKNRIWKDHIWFWSNLSPFHDRTKTNVDCKGTNRVIGFVIVKTLE
jgi:hypothetical protein